MTSDGKDMAIGLSAMLLGLLAAAAAGWMLAGAFGMAGLSVACVAAFLRWPEPFGKALAVAGFVVCGLAVGVGWLAGKMVWVVLAVILFAISPVAGGLFIVGRALVEFADGAERAANRRGAGDCAGSAFTSRSGTGSVGRPARSTSGARNAAPGGCSEPFTTVAGRQSARRSRRRRKRRSIHSRTSSAGPTTAFTPAETAARPTRPRPDSRADATARSSPSRDPAALRSTPASPHLARSRYPRPPAARRPAPAPPPSSAAVPEPPAAAGRPPA